MWTYLVQWVSFLELSCDSYNVNGINRTKRGERKTKNLAGEIESDAHTVWKKGNKILLLNCQSETSSAWNERKID